jgi:hypothetical protein
MAGRYKYFRPVDEYFGTNKYDLLTTNRRVRDFLLSDDD